MSAGAAALLALRCVGFFLLAVLGLLVLALFVPVGVAVRWQAGTLRVQLKVLGGAYTLYPTKPGRAKKAKRSPGAKGKAKKNREAPPSGGAAPADKAAAGSPPQKGAAPQQPAQPQGLAARLAAWARVDPVEKAGHLLACVGPAGRMVLRRLRIRHVEVFWPVTGSDAADTAVRYGAWMAACNNLWARLRQVLDIRADELRLEPDFTGDLAGSERIACQITAQLYIMVAAGVYLLYKVLRDPVLHP